MVHPTPEYSDNINENATRSDDDDDNVGGNVDRDANKSSECDDKKEEQRDNEIKEDSVHSVVKDEEEDQSSIADTVDSQVVQLVRQQVSTAQQQQGEPTLDPNQTYILAGPYTRYDHRRQSYVNYFSARPVPTGMTVIAAPIMQYASAAYPAGGAPSAKQVSMLQTFTARSAHSPASPSAPPIFSGAPSPSPSVPSTPSCPSPTPSSASSGFNPNAEPFFPKSASKVGDMGSSNEVKLKTKRTPCFMYWSSQHPEGTLIPFRQPQPPVYFPN